MTEKRKSGAKSDTGKISRIFPSGIQMTFHDLMLMLGVPDKYACERGGWSTDSILKSVYQQTFSSERKKVDGLLTTASAVL